ncbi:MAG: hypothetical protein ACFBQW_00255 [Sphingomonadaceae bacterium]
MSRFPLLLPFVLAAPAACEEPATPPGGTGSSTPAYERVEGDSSLLGEAETPVTIGDLGPNFAACNARGTMRPRLGPEVELPVRAAPFEAAEQLDSLPAGSAFFICSRSHDQKWFGIVYGAGGAAAECGVSRPVSSRRDYQGPCASGWVPSSFVKLTAGTGAAPLPDDSGAGAPAAANGG